MRYTAQIRRKVAGTIILSISQTFDLSKAAERWLRLKEEALDKLGGPIWTRYNRVLVRDMKRPDQTQGNNKWVDGAPKYADQTDDGPQHYLRNPPNAGTFTSAYSKLTLRWGWT